MRTALLIIALGGFAGLALLDLTAGNVRIGVAAALLVIVNYLLLA